MIDMTAEKLLSFKDAARLLPSARGGKPVSVVTLYGWANKGVYGIKLEYLQMGGQRCTSMEALNRFSQALTQSGYVDERTQAGKDMVVARTEKQKSKAVEKAKKSLKRKGVVK
jgi:hypothetical protein